MNEGIRPRAYGHSVFYLSHDSNDFHLRAVAAGQGGMGSGLMRIGASFPGSCPGPVVSVGCEGSFPGAHSAAAAGIWRPAAVAGRLYLLFHRRCGAHIFLSREYGRCQRGNGGHIHQRALCRQAPDYCGAAGRCEEALHRGFIFHTFKNAGKWTTVIAMGIIFGLFHLHPLRFVATAILGAVLTYIMLETRNLLLPILVHFVNNALSVILTVDATPGGETVALSLASLGILLLPAVVAPFLLMGGSRLLLAKEERRARPVSKAVWATAIITAVVVAITGFTLIVQGVMDLLDEMELVFGNHLCPGNKPDTPVRSWTSPWRRPGPMCWISASRAPRVC